MKRIVCAMALFSLAACTQAPAPVVDTHDADVKAINDLSAAAAKAWAAKNMDAIMTQYASNAVLVVPEAPVTTGTDAIRGMLSELLKDPGLNLTVETFTTDVAGTLGYQRGGYTLQVTDEKTKKPITQKGTSLMVYKKQIDGNWKIVEDFNTALPVAPK